VRVRDHGEQVPGVSMCAPVCDFFPFALFPSRYSHDLGCLCSDDIHPPSSLSPRAPLLVSSLCPVLPPSFNSSCGFASLHPLSFTSSRNPDWRHHHHPTIFVITCPSPLLHVFVHKSTHLPAPRPPHNQPDSFLPANQSLLSFFKLIYSSSVNKLAL